MWGSRHLKSIHARRTLPIPSKFCGKQGASGLWTNGVNGPANGSEDGSSRGRKNFFPRPPLSIAWQKHILFAQNEIIRRSHPHSSIIIQWSKLLQKTAKLKGIMRCDGVRLRLGVPKRIELTENTRPLSSHHVPRHWHS